MDFYQLNSFIISRLESQKPFYLFSEVESTDLTISWGEQKDLVLGESFNEIQENEGFILSPFIKEGGLPSVTAKFKDKKKISIDSLSYIYKKPQNIDIQYNEKRYYCNYNKVHKAIQTGLCSKIVLSSSCELNFYDKQLDLLASFLHAKKRYPQAFVYIFYSPQTSLWFGASPEILLSINQGRAKTMALAGTQEFNANIVWDEKNKQEHKIVADYIREALLKYDISESEDYTMRSGNLLHIRRDFAFNLKNEDGEINSLINSLHPTPAVCGLEREKAYNFIKANEEENRRYYTGLVAYFDKNHTEVYVNLRCACIDESLKKAYCYAGGGIMPDSVLSSEYEEFKNKIKSVIDNFSVK